MKILIIINNNINIINNENINNINVKNNKTVPHNPINILLQI